MKTFKSAVLAAALTSMGIYAAPPPAVSELRLAQANYFYALSHGASKKALEIARVKWQQQEGLVAKLLPSEIVSLEETDKGCLLPSLVSGPYKGREAILKYCFNLDFARIVQGNYRELL